MEDDMTFNEYKPTGKINNKHMLSLKDYTTEEMWEILKCAILLKEKWRRQTSAISDQNIGSASVCKKLRKRAAAEKCVGKSRTSALSGKAEVRALPFFLIGYIKSFSCRVERKGVSILKKGSPLA